MIIRQPCDVLECVSLGLSGCHWLVRVRPMLIGHQSAFSHAVVECRCRYDSPWVGWLPANIGILS